MDDGDESKDGDADNDASGACSNDDADERLPKKQRDV